MNIIAKIAIPALLLFASSQVFADCYKTIDDKTGEAKSYIEINFAAGTGVIKKLIKDPNAKCEKCTGAKKDQPIQGMQIISGMKAADKEDDAEKAGSILDPSSGSYYKLKVWKDGTDLKVKGYWGVIGRSQTWKSAPGMCN